MAPRTVVAQVGSTNWVHNERKEVNNRELECLEDFVVTARNEFEWLNEHMAEIFDGTQQIDVIELLKTPGRMRGKTPRTARKILPLDSRQDVNVNAPLSRGEGDVFGASPQKINNNFFKALNDVRKSASPQKAIQESANTNAEADSDVDMQDEEAGEDDADDGQSTTSSKPPSLVRDSGMWSTSSESGPAQRVSIDPSNQRNKLVSPLKASPTRVEPSSSAETGYRDFSENTRSSFHSAQEMPELARQNTNSSVASIRSVPQEMDVKMASPKKSPQKSPKKQSPVKQIIEPAIAKSTMTTQEPRRSGRLARQSSEKPATAKETDVDNFTEPTKTSSSFTTADSHSTEDVRDEPMLNDEDATEEEDILEEAQAKSPEHTAKLSSEDEPESPTSDSAMSPMQGIVRSSMTFASLPARETLNPKKSIGGSRTSRTSQLENRSSWMGRRTGGKSLGAASKASESAKKEMHEEEKEKAFAGKQAEDDVFEDDEDDELESKLRLAQLNKSSATQRLNERISQLGKQMPLRHTRSVPPPGFGGLQSAPAEEDGASSRPPSSRRPTSDPQGQLSRPTTAHGVATESEEEDWIPARPQMLRAHTAGSTLQSSSEDNILEPASQESLRTSPRLKNQAPFAVPDRTTSMQTIPSRNVLAQVSPTKLPMPTSVASTSSPTKLPMPVGLASPYPKLPLDEVAPKRPISAMPALATTAQEPASPAPYKSPFDNAITGLKNRQATLFSKAKQMLFKTAKAEPSKTTAPESPKIQQPNKLETFASSILRSPTRNQDYSPSPSPKRSFEEESHTPSQPLYPDLNASLKSGPLSPTYNTKANNIYENALKGRPVEAEKPLHKSPNKLREELEREREAFRRAEEKAAAERRLEEQRREETRLAEEVARKAQEERAAYEERKAQEERRLQQERQAQEERRLQEEQKRKEEEERRRKEREVAKTPMNPRTSEMDLDLDSEEEDLTDVEMVQKNPAPKPQQVKPTPTAISRIQPPSSASSLAQKQSALKKPIRAPPAKEVAGASIKGKQAPLNIRLGTASQREMDQRKVPASTATLVNAMAKSFDPSKEESQASQPTPSLTHTSSTSSLKGGKSIASLNLAAKAQKKEQEEAQRKAAQRQEIERRRQENLRREEEKKQAQMNRLKKAAEKTQEEDPRKKTRLGNDHTRPGFVNAKTLPRGLTTANVKKAAEDVRLVQSQNVAAEQSQPELKRQPKRLFQTELDEQEHQKPRQDAIHASQPAQVKSQQQLQPPQQQPEAKRRKTEDHQEDIRQQQQPTYQSGPSGAMRQSNMKKDPAMQTVKPALFSHGYTPAPAHAQHHPPPSSMLKATLQMVSASKGPQVAGGAGLPQVDAVKFSQDKLKFATPAPSKNAAAAYAAKMSPQYTNGDSIELPDIPSDSEDEDEDNDAFNVPEWAESPELRVALQRQLQMDPESVFGPMAPLHMEEIFKGKERSHARFRARTSSANWSGQDRLTTAEIEADRVERQRLIENKGWVFRPPQ